MENNCTFDESFFIDKYHKPIGLIYPHGFENGCCPDRPFIVTVNANGIYSCQCACDMWCTNGHDNMIDAIKEYKGMCENRSRQMIREKEAQKTMKKMMGNWN